MTEEVVILEPNGSGHRLAYVRYIATWVLSEGMTCTWLTSDQAAASNEAAVQLADLTAEGLRTVTTTALTPEAGGWRRLRSLTPLTRSSNVRVVIPDGDRQLFAALVAKLATHRHTRMSLLVMRAAPAGPGIAEWLRHRMKCVLATACRLAGVDTFCLVGPSGEPHRRAVPGRPLRDPVDVSASSSQRATIRSELGLSDGVLVGLFGVVDTRKCPDVVVDAVAIANRTTPTKLVVAGTIAASSRPAIERGVADGIVERVAAGYLHHHDLDRWIAAVDLVAVLHTNDAPSGILARALAIGTPVVTAGSPWLAEETRRTGAGSVAASLRAESVASAFTLRPQRPQRSTPAPDGAQFAANLLGRSPRPGVDQPLV